CIDDVLNVALVPLIVEIGQVLARVLLVALQVVVGAVVDALELLPAEGELEFEVDRARGVVRELVLGVLALTQHRFGYAEIGVPAVALSKSAVVGAGGLAGVDEVLHLHLLELARTEDEVARRDLVAEGLA